MRWLFVVCLLPFAISASAQAEQYAAGSQVVHTRRAPVVAHKVVPPFRGVHVYEGRGGRR